MLSSRCRTLLAIHAMRAVWCQLVVTVRPDEVSGLNFHITAWFS